MRIKNLLLVITVVVAGQFVFAKELSREIHVKVKGMVCSFCAQGIKKTFSKIPEVKKIQVSLEEKFVHLSLKENKSLDSEKILNLIKEAGYEGTIDDKATP